MTNKEIKERLMMIYNCMNKISITGTANAENLTIAAKLLQELFQHIPDEEEEKNEHSN